MRMFFFFSKLLEVGSEVLFLRLKKHCDGVPWCSGSEYSFSSPEAKNLSSFMFYFSRDFADFTPDSAFPLLMPWQALDIIFSESKVCAKFLQVSNVSCRLLSGNPEQKEVRVFRPSWTPSEFILGVVCEIKNSSYVILYRHQHQRLPILWMEGCVVDLCRCDYLCRCSGHDNLVCSQTAPSSNAQLHHLVLQWWSICLNSWHFETFRLVQNKKRSSFGL